MTTLNPTLTARKTGTHTFIDEFGTQIVKDVCEVKARLESYKDAAAWALAISRNPFVAGWSSNNLGVSAKFILGPAADKGILQLQDDILSIYKDCRLGLEFSGRGIEPHVLVESLKLADEFDGDRNGPLSALTR